MSTLETIKNALLISLIIMLVYILYKRMLKVLSKDNIKSKYPEIGNSLTIENTKATILVKTRMPAYLIFEVFDAKGNKKLHIAEGDYEIGDHQVTFDLSSLEKGKYYYKVTSPNQESSQYFEV